MLTIRSNQTKLMQVQVNLKIFTIDKVKAYHLVFASKKLATAACKTVMREIEQSHFEQEIEIEFWKGLPRVKHLMPCVRSDLALSKWHSPTDFIG